MNSVNIKNNEQGGLGRRLCRNLGPAHFKIVFVLFFIVLGACESQIKSGSDRISVRTMHPEAASSQLVASAYIVPLVADQGSLLMQVPYRAVIRLESHLATKVKVGSQVHLHPPLMGNPKIKARVSRISTEGEKAIITAEFRYYSRTLDYMHCPVRFKGVRINAMLVSLSALNSPSGNQASIFKIANQTNKIKRVSVAIVKHRLPHDGRVMILAGDLAVEDRVAVTNINRLVDGQIVGLVK